MRVKIWDIPTRVCHWALALSATFGLYSGFENKFDLAQLFGVPLFGLEWGQIHLYSGYSVLSLCIFRLVWSVLGSSNTRLLTFFPHPLRVFSYAKTLLKPAKRMAGHNPMGSYASLVLIVGFLAQAAMGLYAMDDYFYEGPLVYDISTDDSKEITSLHKSWGLWLIGFISIHIVTILFYRLVRRRNLVTAMITGHDTLSDGEEAPIIAPLWRCGVAIAITAGIVWYWLR